MRIREFLTFLGVTTCAVGRRHNDVNELAIVTDRAGVPRFGTVTLEASDIATEVLAGTPLLVDSSTARLVASDARRTLVRQSIVEYRRRTRTCGNKNQKQAQ
jgi:hypothetical protein